MKGKRLGPYQVLGELASGGMARVFVASHTTLGHVVALKILHPHLQKDELLRKRFVDEARIQANLRHPHILMVQDILELPRSACIVMELLSGSPLSRYFEVAGLPLPLPRLISTFVEVTDALTYAHLDGLVHRDLKPANIFLHREMQRVVPKIMDFGIAKMQGDGPVPRVTAAGTLLGTPHYMAPEQFEDASSVDGRADIFSLGVILYEAITGQLPFQGASIAELMKLIVTKEAPRPSELRPDCPAFLEEVVVYCLKRDREERWPSAAGLRDALRDLAREVGTEPIPIESVPVTRPSDASLDLGDVASRAEGRGDGAMGAESAGHSHDPDTVVVSEDHQDSDVASIQGPPLETAKVADGVALGAELAGCRLLEVIHRGKDTLALRGIRNEDNSRVVIKFPVSKYPPPAVVARLKHEHTILTSLKMEGVVRAIDLVQHDDRVALVVEDFGGEPMKSIIRSGRTSLSFALPVFIRLAETLGALHEQGIIHKDINPNNIILNRTTGETQIIDFGLATSISGQLPACSSHNAMQGTPGYVSPEQTGRMNRVVDHRTDLYSLGVTIYEWLSGVPPFVGAERLDVILAHLSRKPLPLCEAAPEVPEVLSNIVERTLAKTPEERYQTARGLAEDLRECLRQWEFRGTVEPFDLGRHDGTDQFRIPQKLYGRRAEVEQLVEAFAQAAEGHKQMLTVSGYAGIGKTSLVRELCSSVAARRGFFIVGKFDQYKRDIPYGAFIDAIRALTLELLTESEARLTAWRSALLDALGHNGRLITALIPDLAQVIGEQPEVPDLPPSESYNRLNLSLCNVIGVFAKSDHPLAIFLDDLQWADGASLGLIDMLMTGSEEQCLLVLGAYRDNEVGPAHPLTIALNELTRFAAPLAALELRPLSSDHVNDLLTDTLSGPAARCRPLARLLCTKTGGNPFFLIEYLKSLHQQGLLCFEPESNRWEWSLNDIQALDVADNVVDLLSDKLQTLKPTTLQALKLAACVGSHFNLDLLAMVSGKSPGDIIAALGEAVSEGVVIIMGESFRYAELGQDKLADGLLDAALMRTVKYRFSHDKIQQAAYGLIPIQIRQTLHRQIGRLILAGTPPEMVEQRIFDITNQFNLGIELADTASERWDLAGLNLIAGRRAKVTAAYSSALNYLRTGLDLLPENPWEQTYALSLALYEEAAEAAYLNTRFDEMEHYARTVLDNALDLMDKVKVFEVRINGAIAQSNKLEAIEMGLHVLRLLGVKLARKPTLAHVGAAFVRVRLALVGRGPEKLFRLPPMKSSRLRAAMRITSSLISTSYVVDQNLFPVLCLKQVELSARHGNVPQSIFAYALYGTIQCGVLGTHFGRFIDAGYDFGQLALRLMETLDARELRPKGAFAVIATVQHYKEHLPATFQPFRDNLRLALELGDFEYVATSAGVCAYHYFLSGMNLKEFQTELTSLNELVGQLKQKAYLSYMRAYLQAALNLIGKCDDPTVLAGNVADESELLDRYERTQDSHGKFNVYLMKLLLSYLLGNFQAAVEAADRAREYLFSIASMHPFQTFHFFDSLARLAVYREADGAFRRQLLARVRQNQRRMRRWARHSPLNYSHKWHLVEALRVQLAGKTDKAAELYEQAISLANKSGFVHELALAYELTTDFYLAQGKHTMAQAYAIHALYEYTRWGATTKVQQVEIKYGDLLVTVRGLLLAGKPEAAARIGSTSSSTTQSFDTNTLIKASRAIGRQLDVGELLEHSIVALVAHAGATRGLIALSLGDEIFVEAERHAGTDTFSVHEHTAIHERDDLPHTVLNYALRMRDLLVLHDASLETTFSRDAYLTRQRPRSVLCLPLNRHRERVGLIYLENDLAAGIFAGERLETLRLLADEFITCLANARQHQELVDENQRLRALLIEKEPQIVSLGTKTGIEPESR